MTALLACPAVTFPAELMCADVNLVASSECKKVYKELLGKSMLCAGVKDSKTNTCNVSLPSPACLCSPPLATEPDWQAWPCCPFQTLLPPESLPARQQQGQEHSRSRGGSGHGVHVTESRNGTGGTKNPGVEINYILGFFLWYGDEAQGHCTELYPSPYLFTLNQGLIKLLS